MRPTLAIVLLYLIAGDLQLREAQTTQSARPASPFVLPIVKRDSLLNGLQLVVLEQPGTGSVSARLRINSGAMFDLAGKGGLADLTAGMLLRGGGGSSAQSISDTVDRSGLTLNLSVGWDSTDLIISGPSDSLDTIFDLLGRMVISPTFDQKELEALKSSRMLAVKQEAIEDAEITRRKAIETVFGSHPFGRPPRGTADSIGQITRSDLLYFHSRFYIANNSQLVVSGDVTAQLVTSLGRARLGAWKKGEKVPPTFRPPQERSARSILIIDRPDLQQARVAIAQIGFSRRGEDYFAAVILTDLLAENLSALKDSDVEIERSAFFLPGPFLVKLKAAVSELPGVLSSAQSAMTQLQSAAPESEKVEQAKSRFVSAMAEKLKSPDGVAEVLLDIETYGLGRDYLITFAERVSAVTPASIHRAAQNYLKPQTAAIVVAGPAGKLETSLKHLGGVTVVN